MKRLLFIFCVLCGNFMVCAAPYGLLINGTTQLEATALSEKDYQGREQYLVACVELQPGDKVQLHDFGSSASWMCTLDPYGEYQQFSGGKIEGYLTCNAAGSYDFYIKLKYEDDVLYIGAGQNCDADPTPTPDPNATYYVTGSAELVGADKAWSETAIAMIKDEGNTFTYTFSNLAAGTVYRMKITNGTWDVNWGFSAVRNASTGVVGDTDDNVVFELNTKGDVVVSFNGATITLQGNFTAEAPIKPKPTTSVPSACPDVMLQGFYWDSNQDKHYGNTKWTTLQAQAQDIASYFDLIWLPPSALSSGGVGYIPRQYSNQNSDWGSRAELEKLIKTFHDGGAKVVADMVINHMGGKDGWCSFFEQDFGEYGKFQVDGSYICNGDEMNTDSSAGSCNGKATGGNDDGYGDEKNYGAGRDLAHDNEKVRQMFRAYAQWMIDVMDYDGFRYDYCKGFHTSHVGDYNSASGAYFSVMEYWDGNADVLWSRVAEASENSLVFDFGLKYNALNDGIANFNYAKCMGPGLLGKGKGKWAVTFVDNHDTFERDHSEFGGNFYSMTSDMKDRLLQANAFILSMPGVPCVFYPHWKKYKAEIAPMVLARKAVGVHSESAVSDQIVNNGYRATIKGTKGELILELGDACTTCPYGYAEVAAGPGYKMYITYECNVPELIVHTKSTTYRTSTMSVSMSAVGLGGTPYIYYTLDGSDPRTSATKQTYRSAITISGNVTLKAYAELNGAKSDVQTYIYTYEMPQEAPITISFLKPSNWSKAYLYTWTADGKYPTGTWPGMQMTEQNAGGFYFHTLNNTPAREINFILHNHAGTQSKDLLTYDDVCYGWEGEAVVVPCYQGGGTTTDTKMVEPTEQPQLNLLLPMYNVLGQQVGETYRGIIIQNGYKYIR